MRAGIGDSSFILVRERRRPIAAPAEGTVFTQNVFASLPEGDVAHRRRTADPEGGVPPRASNVALRDYLLI